MEYILYCDESCQEGPIVSNFFGGCLVSFKDYENITEALKAKKTELHFFGEVKWTKVTENYLSKYIDIMNLYFSFIKSGKLKVRIIFRCNEDMPKTASKPEDKYFDLYYRFIKNAFGLKHLSSEEKPLYLRVYLDQLPNARRKISKIFKQRLIDLPSTYGFANSPIVIREGDVAEVDSHEHAILQCLDVILGAMYYKLNQLNLVIPEGEDSRGKRTVAKEKLFEHINQHIKDIFPNFDIAKTTELKERDSVLSYWEDPYRHWRFIPD